MCSVEENYICMSNMFILIGTIAPVSLEVIKHNQNAMKGAANCKVEKKSRYMKGSFKTVLFSKDLTDGPFALEFLFLHRVNLYCKCRSSLIITNQ